uniref:Uncharacterized protein n=1 Tax=Bursaphelenchus xylophilus TaxID=6326 RepID=A0A1I7SF24_BURXY
MPAKTTIKGCSAEAILQFLLLELGVHSLFLVGVSSLRRPSSPIVLAMDLRLIALFLVIFAAAGVDGAMRAHMRHLRLAQEKKFDKKPPFNKEKCEKLKEDPVMVDILNTACENCPHSHDPPATQEGCMSNCWDNYEVMVCASNAYELRKLDTLPNPYDS